MKKKPPKRPNPVKMQEPEQKQKPELKHLLLLSVGLVSSIVGLLCYALSSSFERLCGKWNFWKIILYCVVSLIIFCTMIFAPMLDSHKFSWLKFHGAFLVLILTSIYSVYYDIKVVNGKPDVLSVISNGAFALMSLSLSAQTKLGFELGVSSFFLGSFIIQLIEINKILGFVGAVFCYLLMVLFSPPVYCYLRTVLFSPKDPEVKIENVTNGEGEFTMSFRMLWSLLKSDPEGNRTNTYDPRRNKSEPVRNRTKIDDPRRNKSGPGPRRGKID